MSFTWLFVCFEEEDILNRCRVSVFSGCVVPKYPQFIPSLELNKHRLYILHFIQYTTLIPTVKIL